ncbi:DinB family protein [Chitinophaga pendula]|uniref:DinB family protein n=1 Tax=Chitinophaga TaxID=79328 RepID=UPI000BAF5112|nr:MULTISPECIES: DinB family protein [Chitinophaga]ASZ13314.1 hypothetical protein CK934_21295 [Chitinophaga sp. MD30]UCJ09061.1 DinB family protein [Chitinophaga pendula]
MSQVKWFERQFDFTITQNIFPGILERLMGTPARLEEKLRSIPPAQQLFRTDNSWTIKENIGHLSDLEPLWQQRFNDILEGKEKLSVTDLQNTRTTTANHDDVPTEELLQRFRQIRQQTIDMLSTVDESVIFRSALHPRLLTPMRTLDHFMFVADHDDHHLARITELAKRYNEANRP